MPVALQQFDVRIMPDDHVQVAQFGNLFEKADVARMEPVKAAGHQHPLAVRRDGHLGQTGRQVSQVFRPQHAVLQTVGTALGPLGLVIARRIDDPGCRSEDLRAA